MTRTTRTTRTTRKNRAIPSAIVLVLGLALGLALVLDGGCALEPGPQLPRSAAVPDATAQISQEAKCQTGSTGCPGGGEVGWTEPEAEQATIDEASRYILINAGGWSLSCWTTNTEETAWACDLNDAAVEVICDFYPNGTHHCSVNA